jgi:hypothetical protein
MRSEPDAQPDGPDANADVQESVERSGHWARARQSPRVPGGLVRGIDGAVGRALAELEVVRATPLPPAAGERTSLRSWYEATVRILILAGFLSAPDEDEVTGQLTRSEMAMRAVRFVVAELIWALTWVVPVTFMIMMSWACESDARRFGQRVTMHYGDEGDDIAIASADGKAGRRQQGAHRRARRARGALARDPAHVHRRDRGGRQGAARRQRPAGGRSTRRPRAGHHGQHRRAATVTAGV